MSEYTCPGRAIREPEHFVACYRAGHACPPKVAIRTENETHRTVDYRCPCCGDWGGTICTPKSWDAWDAA